MPEGPEVELVVKGLQTLKNHRITRVFIAKHRKYEPQASYFQRLVGQKITRITRKGKWIIFTFHDSTSALHHLGMTGTWRILHLPWDHLAKSFNQCVYGTLQAQSFTRSCDIIDFMLLKNQMKASSFLSGLKPLRKNRSTDGVPIQESFIQHNKSNLQQDSNLYLSNPCTIFHPHDKLGLLFENNLLALFNDVRTFGYFNVFLSQNDVWKQPQLQALGPDILSIPFPLNEFRLKLREHPTMTIAQALLNPKIIAGCGNIYRNEALFESKINPFRKIKDLSDIEIRTLSTALSNIAHRALKLGGSTINDFHAPSGKTGKMQVTFKIYGKANRPCPSCGTLISRVKLNGRSVYWCPSCQI